jgi:ATP-dependent Lhr-like helicase
MDHPLVRQTIDDCLHEAMDVEGFLAVLRGLENGTIARVAVDTPEPSVFAGGILASQPYTFLDDAPLEERRTQAVMRRRGGVDSRTLEFTWRARSRCRRRVREEAWPHPEHAEGGPRSVDVDGLRHGRRSRALATVAGGAARAGTGDVRWCPLAGG